MWAMWIGVVLVLLKAADVGPVAGLSWYWVLLPLGVALIWFEVLEKLFGRDRRRLEHDELEQRRQERIEAVFGKRKRR